MKIKQWETKQLDDVATFSSGGTPSKEEENYWEGDYPWISAKDMKSFSIKDAGLKLTPEGLAVAKIAKKGSILVLVRGMTLLKDLPVGYVERDVAFNQDIKALVAKSGVSGLFLAYALIANKNRILNLVNVAGHGTGRLDTTLLKEFPIDLPPLLEQCSIAEVLGIWDESIDLLERLIGKVRSRKQGLMQQLLTGKKRFKEFEGSEWKEYCLGDLFDERKETCYEHLPLLSITREKGIIFRDEVERKDNSNSDKSKYLHICPGDIGYNTMRMWQGVSALSAFEGIVSPAYTILIPRKEVNGSFFGFLFKYYPIVSTFERYSQGLTSDTWTLKIDSFSKIRVNIPSLPEQEKIAAVLSAADEEISTLEKQLAAYKQQKLGLMQQLLTGRIRI